MDLSKSYPASVSDEFHGLVQIKRTIDKGVATAEGTPGEYHYNCPMDQAVFSFLGIDHEALMDTIKKNLNDRQAINDYVGPFIHAKNDDEIAAWNKEWLLHGPDAGSESEGYFNQLRSEVAPTRTDVTSWADLLDLDEKRSVPERVAV